MTGQELKDKALGILKAKMKEALVQMNDEVVPELLTYAETLIPGELDNLAIDAAKPVVNMLLKSLIEKL